MDEKIYEVTIPLNRYDELLRYEINSINYIDELTEYKLINKVLLERLNKLVKSWYQYSSNDILYNEWLAIIEEEVKELKNVDFSNNEE